MEADSVRKWTPAAATALAQAQETVQKTRDKKRKREKQKEQQSQDRIEELDKNCQAYRYIVGLDLSITSSGMAILDRVERTCHLVGFCDTQEKRRVMSKINSMPHQSMTMTHLAKGENDQTWRVSLHLSENKQPREVQHNTERFDYGTDALMKQLHVHAPCKETLVIIENYAFDAHGSYLTHAAELTGVIQNKLCT
jgi:hypothetical protein